MKKIIFFLTLLTTLTLASESNAATACHVKHTKTTHKVIHHKALKTRVVKSTSYLTPTCSSGVATVPSVSSTGFMTTPSMSSNYLPPVMITPLTTDTTIVLGALPDATWTGGSRLIGSDMSTDESANTYYHNYHSATTTVNGYTIREQNLSHAQNGKGVDQTAGYGVSPRAGALPENFGYGMPTR